LQVRRPPWQSKLTHFAESNGRASTQRGDNARGKSAGLRAIPFFAGRADHGFQVCRGFSTGSLGILSEALQLQPRPGGCYRLRLLSVRVSDKPADADHQYGHRQSREFFRFYRDGPVLITCVWIVYEAFKRTVPAHG